MNYYKKYVKSGDVYSWIILPRCCLDIKLIRECKTKTTQEYRIYCMAAVTEKQEVIINLQKDTRLMDI